MIYAGLQLLITLLSVFYWIIKCGKSHRTLWISFLACSYLLCVGFCISSTADMTEEKPAGGKGKGKGKRSPEIIPPPEVSPTGVVLPVKLTQGNDTGTIDNLKTGNTKATGSRAKQSSTRERSPQANRTRERSPLAKRDCSPRATGSRSGNSSENMRDILRSLLLEMGQVEKTSRPEKRLAEEEVGAEQPPKLHRYVSDSDSECEESVEKDGHACAVDEDQIDLFLASDSEKENDEGDWLSEFARDLAGSEESGPAINEELAGIVEKMLKNKLTEDKAKELLAKYLRPENVPTLANPRVNAHIWAKLKEPTRKADIRLSHVGEKLVKGVIGSTKVANQLFDLKSKVLGDTRKEVKSIMRTALDTVRLGAAAVHELSQKRRQALKPDLHPSYRGLCSAPKEEGTELFGNNLNDRIKELPEVNRMGSKVADHGGRYNRGRYSSYPSSKRRLILVIRPYGLNLVTLNHTLW